MFRVAVVRMLPGLGDLLCAVPALHGLRRALPTARVTFVGRRSSRWFPARYADLLDDWIGCDWCPGLVESMDDAGSLAHVVNTARARRFDVAIQMHGDGRVTNGFTASLRARRWGGLSPSPRCADGTRFVPAGTHEIDRCVEAVRASGIAIEPGPLDFPLTPDDRRPAEVPSGSIAVVHPGASRPDRRWAAESFAAVTEHLLGHADAVALTGGAGERDVARAVRDGLRPSTRERVVDVSGRTSIGSLAALLSHASVVVSNDTGVAHLAAAVDAPAVTVFGDSDRPRWEPRGRCGSGVTGERGWPSVEQVTSTVDAVLERAVAC